MGRAMNGYRYLIALYRKTDGCRLDEMPLTVDWTPAVEWTRFWGIRRGLLPAREIDAESGIEPRWDEKLGPPFVGGFRVSVSGNGRGEISHDFPKTYFRGAAQLASSDLVKRSLLEPGELFYYIISAFPCQRDEQPARGTARFTVRPLSPRLPIRETRMADFAEGAVRFEETGPEDMPVFIRQHILDEMMERTRAAGKTETGGILIGHLHRDGDAPEIFVETTAQIPARHTHSELAKLTFTKETWTDVQSAINLRKSDEIMVGWWHSHPFFQETCGDCQKQKDKTCKVDALFMSADDCVFHRTVFPRAYGVGLVVSNTPCQGLAYALFGWNYTGTIARRGFHVLDAVAPDAPTALAAIDTTGGSNHAATP
jgi:proteasome lid subunit RPN8/RPN11